MEFIIRSLGQISYWFGRRRVFTTVPRGGVCAEIGVWRGDFSQRILDVLAPKELHLIDPWLFAPHFPRRWYGGSLARGQADMDAIMESVRQRFRTSPAVQIHRAESMAAVEQFPANYFDWVYIDGDHSTSAVLADLEAWYPKLKPQGSLVLDDYYWRDEAGKRSVKAAVDAFLGNRPVGSCKTVAGQFILNVADGHPGAKQASSFPQNSP